jgi:hypothetical protein
MQIGYDINVAVVHGTGHAYDGYRSDQADSDHLAHNPVKPRSTV